MLYLYIPIGIILLSLLLILSNRYIYREKRYKIKLHNFLKTKEYTSAIEFAKKLISMNKRNPEYYLLLAEIYQDAKLIPSAVKTYEEMLSSKIYSVKTQEHHIREKLAFISLNQGNPLKAFSEFYKIVQLNPTSSFGIGQLGVIYGSQGKYDKAKDLLKRAIKINHDNAEFHYQLGLAYLDTGELSPGFQELESAHKLNPGHIKCQYFLALALREKGEQEKANELFNKLNIKDLSKLPNIITRVGVMTQNIPKFDITAAEEKLVREASRLFSGHGAAPKVSSINELMKANADIFLSAAIASITKMGYIIQKEVKTELSDSSSEINFIAVLKKDKDNPSAKKFFIQFTRTKNEIGNIPYYDFLARMNQMGTTNGIFIITSKFSASVPEEIKKEKANIILIDANKLLRYL